MTALCRALRARQALPGPTRRRFYCSRPHGPLEARQAPQAPTAQTALRAPPAKPAPLAPLDRQAHRARTGEDGPDRPDWADRLAGDARPAGGNGTHWPDRAARSDRPSGRRRRDRANRPHGSDRAHWTAGRGLYRGGAYGGYRSHRSHWTGRGERAASQRLRYAQSVRLEQQCPDGKRHRRARGRDDTAHHAGCRALTSQSAYYEAGVLCTGRRLDSWSSAARPSPARI